MAITALTGRAETNPPSVLEDILGTTRALIEALGAIEFRLAAITALTEIFAASYIEQASLELLLSLEQLRVVETKRQAALSEQAALLGLAPTASLEELLTRLAEPTASALSLARAELVRAKARVNAQRDRAESLLGRRIVLVGEALLMPGERAEMTYGRTSRPRARLVSGVL